MSSASSLCEQVDRLAVARAQLDHRALVGHLQRPPVAPWSSQRSRSSIVPGRCPVGRAVSGRRRRERRPLAGRVGLAPTR